MTGYVYDQGWKEERQRLAGMEALWDPGSRRLLEQLGLGPGARVLEVGGGGGALAEWMCETVGAEGSVVATDLDTRFLDAIEHDALEVLTHDIAADPLPAPGFDVIHTRLVLEHLPAREAVLDKLVTGLVPGGWLVVEDYVWRSFAGIPDSPLLDEVGDAVLGFMTENGFDSNLGVRLPDMLRARGLQDVRGEGRSLVITLEDPGAAFFRLSLTALAPVLVEQGRLKADVAEQAVALLDEPGRSLHTPTMVAGIGRGPG